MKLARWIALLAVVAIAVSALAGCGGAKSAKYPAKSIELVAAGSPGGGLDTAARVLDDVIKKEKVNVNFTITNKEGGGGNVARSYLVEKKNDDYVLIYESNRVWLNNLMGTTQYSIEDTTPIARTTTEFEAWAVKAASKFKTAQDIIDAVKKDPASVTFGVGTIPSDDQFNILRPLMAKGVDVSKVKLTAFRSGGDLMTNLLGGHVDVISTSVSEAAAQAEAGKARILAVSSDKRLTGKSVKDTPTWKELGIDVVISHWRGLFGPPGMSAAAVKYWDDTLGKLVKTKSWSDALAKMEQEDAYLSSAAFKDYLLKERGANKPIIEQFVGKKK